MKKLFLILALIFVLVGCNDKYAYTRIKVIYTNGDSEQLTLTAHPDNIYFHDAEIKYRPYDNRWNHAVTAASLVRRYEVVETNDAYWLKENDENN